MFKETVGLSRNELLETLLERADSEPQLSSGLITTIQEGIELQEFEYVARF